MSLYDQPAGGNGMVMPVTPMNSYGGSYGFGNDGLLWIIVLMLCGWGGFGFGGGYGRFGGYGDGAGATTVIDSSMQRGFDQQAVMGGINGITSSLGNMSNQLCNGFANVNQGMSNGFAGVNQALCGGFAGVNQSIFNGFANAETANNARQIANMQQAFANQTAMSQGFNELSSQFGNCCCENRLASCQTQNILQNEGSATRMASATNTRDILEAVQAMGQSIKDQICSDKIDAKNEKIAELQNQLTLANIAASRTAETSRILADNAMQTAALEQYLNPPAIPAYIVQNPNCCAPNYSGCSCGMYS